MRGMFRSARVKLTLFYLAALLAFSLSVTGTIRVLAEREYERSNDAQRSEVRQLFPGKFWIEGKPQAFYDAQDYQAALVRQHLNQELIMINICALMLGGLLSYWFAGRTLKPIEEAHEAQARFAADASHELRTPLTNMQLENEIFLRQKEFTQAEARSQIKSNLEEVQRLEQLSASLLDLTRYGRASLTLKPLSVSEVVRQAVEAVEKSAKAKHRKVRFVADDIGGLAVGDNDSLVQLVSIVLDNAVKYGPANGTVRVQGKPGNGGYVLRISDDGPGIAADDLPFIFDRLYRGDKARSSQTGGYGLGLALAQEIATANRATISASNGPQGGAVFEIRLGLAD
jgi:two-component system, OmpR family, sensor histidine kinase CiaH